MLKKKNLRSGYTTGACAAAAAKAATILIMRHALCVRDKETEDCSNPSPVTDVEIPFPDGGRVSFKVFRSSLVTCHSSLTARASVIKDAGDDPDVTNGAEIAAEASFKGSNKLKVTSNLKDSNKSEVTSNELKTKEDSSDLSLVTPHSSLPLNSLLIKGGRGVGIVTKPGLSMPVGEAAINPVPRKMIREAVIEAIKESAGMNDSSEMDSSLVTRYSSLPLEITISVPEGEELAKKTLNHRLGITGGISILGTTGIVRPISSEAWTATIAASMDVAKAMGHSTVVLSSGRTSEKAHMEKFALPEEAYVMMGDYLEFSLREAKGHGFSEIHLCAQWAKMLKIAMATPQTHVRHGALNVKKAAGFLRSFGIEFPEGKDFNTAREIFDSLIPPGNAPQQAMLAKVCSAAQRYAEGIAAGPPVTAYLVSYEGEVIAQNE